MENIGEVTIISNRSGEQLCERVKEDFALKLEESDREKFKRKNVFSKNFPSGEVYVQLQENIRRSRVHVIIGSYRPELHHLRRQVLKLDSNTSVSEILMSDYLHSVETDFIEALKILDAAKRSGAQEISAYFPYFADSRQDKKDESRVPISAKLKFKIAETAAWPKLSRIGLMDIHARQEQAFTEYPVDTMTAKSHLILALKHQGVSFEDLVLICADTNDYKNMRTFADNFGIGAGAIAKARKGHNVVDKRSLYEGDEVEGKVCAVIDDMFDTSNTLFNAVEILAQYKPKKIYACATHGIFSPTIDKETKKINFVEDKLKQAYEKYGLRVITTDTIARTREYLHEHKDWLTMITVAPLISDLIYCNEKGESHGKKLDSDVELARTNNGSALEKFLCRE